MSLPARAASTAWIACQWDGVAMWTMVVLVDVANRHEPALLVTGEMERGHADASDADDAPCKLVAGGHEPFVSAHGTENVPGKQGESGDAGACFLEE